MEPIVEIKVRAFEKTTRDGDRKFLVFTTNTKLGEKVRVKFTKKANCAPVEKGNYLVKLVDSTEYANMSNDDFGKVLWISKVVSIEPIQKESGLSTNF